MKILILGQHTYNYGDEGAGTALVQKLLGKKNVDEVNITYRIAGERILPIDSKKITNINNLFLNKKDKICIILLNYYFRGSNFDFRFRRNVNEFKKLIRENDVIIVSPMGANIGIYKDYSLLCMLLLVIADYKVPIFHLCTINGSGNKVFDHIAKFVLKNSKVFVREKKSVEYLKLMNIDSTFGIDTAFCLDNSHLKQTEDRKGYIVLILTDLGSWNNKYKELDLLTIVSEYIFPQVRSFALQNDLKIKVLVHSLWQNEYAFNDEITEIINSNNVDKSLFSFALDINSVFDYENCIANAYLVFTMRYHGIVFSVKNHVPFVALSYENKMEEVSNYSGCNYLCKALTEIEKGDNYISDSFEYLKKNYSKIVEDLHEFTQSEIFQSTNYPIDFILNSK